MSRIKLTVLLLTISPLVLADNTIQNSKIENSKVTQIHTSRTTYITKQKFSPKELKEINRNTKKIFNSLESIKQKVFISEKEKPTISAEQKQLGKQIPDNASDYSLALKAITEERFDLAMNLLSKSQVKEEEKLFNIYIAKAQTQYYQGLYLAATEWYKKALYLKPDDIDILTKTASVFINAKEYDQAEELYNRALSIDKTISGEEHPNVANDLNNLAVLYRIQKKYTEAEESYERALEIWQKSPGENLKIAFISNNLAWLYFEKNEQNKAEQFFKKALNIEKQLLGEKHFDVARDLNNLALFYETQEKYIDAEPLYVHSLTIFKEILGEYNPNTELVRKNLQRLQSKMV